MSFHPGFRRCRGVDALADRSRLRVDVVQRLSKAAGALLRCALETAQQGVTVKSLRFGYTGYA